MPRKRVVHIKLPDSSGKNPAGESTYSVELSLTDMEELLALIDDGPVDEIRLKRIRRTINLTYKQLSPLRA